VCVDASPHAHPEKFAGLDGGLEAGKIYFVEKVLTAGNGSLGLVPVGYRIIWKPTGEEVGYNIRRFRKLVPRSERGTAQRKLMKLTQLTRVESAKPADSPKPDESVLEVKKSV
jgi:hypothetical protein